MVNLAQWGVGLDRRRNRIEEIPTYAVGVAEEPPSRAKRRAVFAWGGNHPWHPEAALADGTKDDRT